MCTRSQKKLVTDFNDNTEVGSSVRYWTGVRVGPGILSKTRTEAEMLGRHTAVVWVEGHGARIALSHVETVVDQ